MRFFANLNFARSMILVCLLISLPLAYLNYEYQERISVLSEAIGEGGELSRLIPKIQANSALVTDLEKKKSADNIALRGGMGEYIRRVGNDESVQMGRLDFPSPKVTPLGRGGNIVDEVYTIKPGERNKEYSRINIANFLFSLEDRTRHLRVTRFSINALSKDGKASVPLEELPADRWRLNDCKVTLRHRKADG